jgi:seryl-tRNA synthetase
LPKFKEDLYELVNEQFLIPTAEVPLTGLFQYKTFTPEELPVLLCAYSLCFRQEAGDLGKYSKGLLRMHQFNKVELVNLTDADTSYQALEKMVNHVEAFLKMLELPYQVVALGEKNVGFQSAKTYDIEVWSPYHQKYVEVSSCSNCESFQTYNFNIKYESFDRIKKYAHSLNGSGLAIDRIIALLLENNYDEKTNTVN